MDIHIHVGTYRQTAKAIGLNARVMNKDIIATIVGSDKAKALFGIKPLYSSRLCGKGSTQATRSSSCCFFNKRDANSRNAMVEIYEKRGMIEKMIHRDLSSFSAAAVEQHAKRTVLKRI